MLDSRDLEERVAVSLLWCIDVIASFVTKAALNVLFQLFSVETSSVS